MLINLLNRIGVREVLIAGFDGQKNGVLYFFDDAFDRNKMKSTNGEKVKNILASVFQDMNLKFITESEYV